MWRAMYMSCNMRRALINSCRKHKPYLNIRRQRGRQNLFWMLYYIYIFIHQTCGRQKNMRKNKHTYIYIQYWYWPTGTVPCTPSECGLVIQNLRCKQLFLFH